MKEVEKIETSIRSGVICFRTHEADGSSEVVTNVEWSVIHHSPDGFEWGYFGSGPADFALNILEAFLTHMGYHGERVKCYNGDCWHLAWQLHQGFKNEFVAMIPHAGTVIAYETIIDWLWKWAEGDLIDVGLKKPSQED